jgi:hypothetical protein
VSLLENAELIHEYLIFSGDVFEFAPQTCHENSMMPKMYVWKMCYATQHIFENYAVYDRDRREQRKCLQGSEDALSNW